MNDPHTAPAARVPRYAVKHRDGWCAVQRGHVPQEGEWSTPTACGLFVTAPWDFSRGLRNVDCKDCHAL